MSTVINKDKLEIRRSVHTPDYSGKDDWLINPKLPDCSKKYWKVAGANVTEMTSEEKSVKDAELTTQQQELLEEQQEQEVRLKKVRGKFQLLGFTEEDIELFRVLFS